MAKAKTIEALSPGRAYVRLGLPRNGTRWIANDGTGILAVLTKQAPRRREAF